VFDVKRPLAPLLAGQTDQRVQLYLVHSANATAGADGAKGNLFVASLSNLILPTVTYAYFSAEAQYSLEKIQPDNNNWDFSVGASGSGMAVVFTRMFQFIDVNEDGEFTEGTDKEKDEYKFMQWIDLNVLPHPFLPKIHIPYPKPIWDAGSFSKDTQTMKIQTADGQFAVTLKANKEEGRTPGGSRKTPMTVKMDVDINYPDLQEGHLVGLEAYVVTTKAEGDASSKGTLQVGNGVFSMQPNNLPPLGLAWDGQAKVDTEGDVSVKASGMVDASLKDIDVNGLQGGMGIKAKGSINLDVKKVTYSFKSSQVGKKIIWDPVFGATSAEEQARPEDAPGDALMSGVGGVARHIIMFLAAFLPVTLTALNSAIGAA